MDSNSKITIQNKDVIIEDPINSIEITNSNVLLYLFNQNNVSINIETHGKNKIIFIVKDSEIKLNINNFGDTIIKIKTISFNDSIIKLDTFNKGKIKIFSNSINYSNLEIIGSLNVDSQKTESRLILDSLNMSASKTILIPILNVRKNDVIVQHSALSHKIRSSKIFYLMSKGLSKEIAKKIILKSYLLDESMIFEKEIEEKIESLL